MDEQRRSRLSVMMDGEATAAERQQWWQSDVRHPAAAEDWHTYHLIGDVMRSADLATTRDRDRILLTRVRAGLEAGPVVMAPAAVRRPSDAALDDQGARSGPRQRRRLWAATAAVVAGFGVVMTAYVSTRVEVVEFPSGIVVSMAEPVDDVRRASVVGAAPRAAHAEWPWALSAPVSGFREILRLPRGSSQQPGEGTQVLYSNGSATISVVVEPYRPGQHVPRTETSERLNTLTVQRQDVWLTLSGDVPMGTLQQMALALQPQP